jgi:hypothetical protein
MDYKVPDKFAKPEEVVARRPVSRPGVSCIPARLLCRATCLPVALSE